MSIFFNHLLIIILNIVIDVAFVIYAYNTFITLFSWKIKQNKGVRDCSSLSDFIVLIPAHNEEEVIIENLEALANSEYDLTHIFVYVIADNCTDLTESLCKSYKRLHNLNVIKVDGGNKAKAISLAVDTLKQQKLWNKDNILVLDADNKVSPTLVSSYNYYHNRGSKLLQCRIDSQNDDSFVSKGFASSFNTMNFGFQYARNRLGLSGSLSGTGFSVSRYVWDTIGFSKCTTLTEDLEFSIYAILSGYKVNFVLEEYVLNQNLDSFIASLIQRTRWCRGHVQVSIKMNKKLIMAFLKKPSVQLMDSLFFLNTPSKSFLYTACTIILFIHKDKHHIDYYFKLALMAYNIAFVIRCNLGKIGYIIPQIAYSICMYFIILYSLFTYRKTKWNKTKHKKKHM